MKVVPRSRSVLLRMGRFFVFLLIKEVTRMNWKHLSRPIVPKNIAQETKRAVPHEKH